ncbi:hypothetical protein PFISCL1PPCAC_23798 [Pristionchus fissidentatus]|uniref:Uncharacterized protein n=1 Tax=Pristionchus fissidentatus TaxID=1538716 RepID=A0AAV5WKJ4_9BILA|nr:hypothetical protein PFISCL1PPCAC_23798 [Pristionchus fissidentatus]
MRILLLLTASATLAAAAPAAAAAEKCNQDSTFTCNCSSCWGDDLPISGPIDWITIDTDGCDVIDERNLRTKLASWSTEECGSSVHCGIKLPISPEQILLGRLSCDAKTRVGAIAVGLLRDPATKGMIEQGSLLPASQLGLILHSREHLLAIALRAHLRSMQMTRRLAPIVPSTTTTTTTTTTAPGTSAGPGLVPTPPIGVGLAVGAFVLVVLFLVVYAVWGRIEWKQVMEGRWKRRVYRKVPDVFFRSADEIPPTVTPPHSASFHSTTQLIRY